MKANKLWRTAGTILLLAVMWVLWTSTSLAHYCDDHYYSQQAREACWWRYWNNAASYQDTVLANQAQQHHTQHHHQQQYHHHHYKQGHHHRAWKAPYKAHYKPQQYTTKPHRLHPSDPRIAPWDRVKHPYRVVVYKVPVHHAKETHWDRYYRTGTQQKAAHLPEGPYVACGHFRSRADYEAYYADYRYPWQHDGDHDGLFCEGL